MSSNDSSSSSSSRPRYHAVHNPAYQINHRAKRSGRHITASKRRITFQFGFSSGAAIASGRQGAECRGEEHEVVLIWSHLTGKRQVVMDGREVHRSKGGGCCGNTTFQHSWTMLGDHLLQLVAHAAPPSHQNASLPKRRQFDLLLDGRSFFDLCRIYQLGTSSRQAAAPAAYAYRGVSYAGEHSDEEDLEEPLEDHGEEPFEEPLEEPMDLLQAPAAAFDILGTDLPPLASSASTRRQADQFAPLEAGMSHQRSFDEISHEILHAYKADLAAPRDLDSPTSVANLLSPAEPFSFSQTDQKRSVPSTTALVLHSSVDDITKSLRHLVNLDDINSKPFSPIKQLSHTANSSARSQGLPPASDSITWNMAGRAPTLAEINAAVKHQALAPSKQIMKQNLSNQRHPMQNSGIMPGALVQHGMMANGNTHGAYSAAY